MLHAFSLAALALLPPSTSYQESATTPGWIGVSLAADEAGERRLSVLSVAEDSPAERAGLRAGDRLLALDDRELESYTGLLERLGELGPGRDVRLWVARSVEIELDRRGQGQAGGPRLGVHLGQQPGPDGDAWIVRAAEPGWPAARAGLRAGDRIVSLEGRRPETFDELQEILGRVEPGHELSCEIERSVELRLGRRPGEPSPGSYRLVPEPDQQGLPRLRLTPLQPSYPRQPPELALPRQPDARLPRSDPGRTQEQPGDAALRRELAELRDELQSLRSELHGLLEELESLRSRPR